MYKSALPFMLFLIVMRATGLRQDRRLQILFHALGLSCLGGAIFLQALVFADILQHGYFTAVEGNPAVLVLEIVLTAFALAYFLFLYQRFIRSVR